MPDRICFVIGPFGEPDSQVRKWSDFLLHDIIEPVTSRTGLDSHRTLDMPAPGRITDRVMRELRGADIVIADLTHTSPNALYELGVRHETGKPVLHMAQAGTALPFDVKDWECIMIEAHYVESERDYLIADDKKRKAQEALAAQLSRAQEPPTGSLSRYAMYVFSWRTRYSRTIATDWLAKQPQPIQDSIMNYERQAENQAFTEPVRRALAEYLQLKSAANQTYNGTMFLVVTTLPTRRIEMGGAVYLFPDTPPIYMPIDGFERPDKNWEITFDQPSRRVRVGPIDEVLPAFNYTVVFRLEGDTLVGDIEHPFAGTLIGQATLSPKYGTRLR
jgi:hypothetical protein